MSWRRRILGSRLKTPNMEHQRQHIILPFLQPPRWWEFLLTSAGKNLVFAFHNCTRVVGFTFRKVAPDSFTVHVSQVSYLHLVKDFEMNSTFNSSTFSVLQWGHSFIRWPKNAISRYFGSSFWKIPPYLHRNTEYNGKNIPRTILSRNICIYSVTQNISRA